MCVCVCGMCVCVCVESNPQVSSREGFKWKKEKKKKWGRLCGELDPLLSAESTRIPCPDSTVCVWRMCVSVSAYVCVCARARLYID